MKKEIRILGSVMENERFKGILFSENAKIELGKAETAISG